MQQQLDIQAENIPPNLPAERGRKPMVEYACRIARWLDMNGKPDADITVSVKRDTMLRAGLKPKKRGAPLMIGDRRVICSDENHQ